MRHGMPLDGVSVACDGHRVLHLTCGLGSNETVLVAVDLTVYPLAQAVGPQTKVMGATWVVVKDSDSHRTKYLLKHAL